MELKQSFLKVDSENILWLLLILLTVDFIWFCDDQGWPVPMEDLDNYLWCQVK